MRRLSAVIRPLALLIGLVVCTIYLAMSKVSSPTSLAAESLGTWDNALARLPVSTGEVAVAELDGFIYVVGGVIINAQGNTVRTTNVWRYNPSTDSWQQRAAFPGLGLDHVMIAPMNGKLYMFGGLRNWPYQAVRTVYEYTPSSDSWATKAQLPLADGLGAAGVAALGDKIYLAGGSNASSETGGALTSMLAYTPASDSWQVLRSMPTPRDHLVLVALNGRLHAIGGRDIEVYGTTGAHEIYDPTTNTWATAAPMPSGRGGHGAGVLNGRVVIFGGEGKTPSGFRPSGGVFALTQEYDPATNSWRELSPMPRIASAQTASEAGRHGTYGASFNNTLYVPGGSTREGNEFSDIHASFMRPLAATPIPATNTSTATSTATTTPLPPTATSTATTGFGGSVATATNTLIPSSATSTGMPSPITTSSATSTLASISPTATSSTGTGTSTATTTSSATVVTEESTPTAVGSATPPIVTRTATAVPVPMLTSTATAMNLAATSTATATREASEAPGATSTATATREASEAPGATSTATTEVLPSGVSFVASTADGKPGSRFALIVRNAPAGQIVALTLQTPHQHTAWTLVRLRVGSDGRLVVVLRTLPDDRDGTYLVRAVVEAGPSRTQVKPLDISLRLDTAAPLRTELPAEAQGAPEVASQPRVLLPLVRR